MISTTNKIDACNCQYCVQYLRAFPSEIIITTESKDDTEGESFCLNLFVILSPKLKKLIAWKSKHLETFNT